MLHANVHQSVIVDDQAKARDFYTRTLGFVLKHDIPMGEFSWLTLTAPGEPDGVELALEPNQYPAARALQESLKADGVPWTAFSVDDLDAETARLKAAGVIFTTDPMQAGPVKMAIFDDTCGNLIQLIEPAE